MKNLMKAFLMTVATVVAVFLITASTVGAKGEDKVRLDCTEFEAWNGYSLREGLRCVNEEHDEVCYMYEDSISCFRR